MKTSQNLDPGLGGIRQELTQTLPPWGLAPTVADGMMQTAKGEKKSIDPLNCKAHEAQQRLSWQGVS